MAFRADESQQRGYERAKRYLVGTHLVPKERRKVEDWFYETEVSLGPVIDSYPTWHPLVAHQSDPRFPATSPSDRLGYEGLDHTILFAHGFVTCPYHDGQAVIDSVKKLPHHPVAQITAERINLSLYADGTDPILVRCEWSEPLEIGKQIPKKLAVPLMVEQELPAWRTSSVGETWETMKPYILGEPHGSRSSLFVDQNTALAMKRVYAALVESGMYGPVLMR